MRRTKISKICTAIAVLLSVTSCHKETTDNQEISMFECVYTNTDGRIYASSELLYWLEREDFSPNVYMEGGLIWVKGSEDIKNIREGIEERIAAFNEKIEGYGTFSYRDYSPVWKTSVETKGETQPLEPIEVSSEEFQKLQEQLIDICRQYPNSGIEEKIIQMLFDKMGEKFKPLTVEKVLFIGCYLIVAEYLIGGLVPWQEIEVPERLACMMEISDAVLDFCIAKYLFASNKQVL